MFKVDLRRLILALCFFSVLLSLAAGLFASYLVQRNLLLESSMESNRVYARKLATLSEGLLRNVHQEIAYIADRAPDWNLNASGLAERLDQLNMQSDHFDSIIAVAPDGVVRAESPQTLGLAGKRLNTERAEQALTRRMPILSEPYLSVTGRWLITQLVPMFTRDGVYDGYIAGSMYLHENSALNDLLGNHFFKDGSYSYVVDRHGVLIYHPSTHRIGEKVTGNFVIEALTLGESGEQRVENTEGVRMVAGFAAVHPTGWGVVVQRPEALVLERLNALTRSTVLNALPLLLMTLIIVFLLSSQIVRPLRALAQFARVMDNSRTAARLQELKCWYLEATLLKRALLSALWAINHKIKHLKQESATDALSGLLNRRGLQASIDTLGANAHACAVIVLDIDRFKSINDTFGHSAGDAVIQMVADRMRHHCRESDIASRSGGEEFVMLLPETSADDAFLLAEKLRLDIATVTATGEVGVTVSCGIAHWPGHTDDLTAAWRLADQALYHAKRSGRNRSHIAEPDQAERYVSPSSS